VLASFYCEDSLNVTDRHTATRTIASLRKQLSSLQHILDLASVELHLCQSVQFLVVQMTSEGFPYLAATIRRQGWIMQADVDSAMKGIIDLFDSVGSQEQNALIVLKHAEEDGHQLVALKVRCVAGFQKDVGFVQQEDGIPLRRHLENPC
jgi:hypothetical protein